MSEQDTRSPTDEGDSPWVEVAALDALLVDTPHPVRVDGRVLILVRLDDEEVSALDGRCPHEGYPLVQGDVCDGLLTCAWHNWKFDVRSGTCIKGGEGVRRWPTRIVDGAVEVDASRPPASVVVPEQRADLTTALHEGDLGRAVRAVARLLDVGDDPLDVMMCVAVFDADHGEYGTTHTLPLIADLAELLEHVPADDVYMQCLVIAPALALAIDRHKLRPRRPVATPCEGGREAFVAAIEEEDVERAEGIVRHAARSGRPWRTLASWLASAMSGCFTGFGHELIYLTRLVSLLERVDAPTDPESVECAGVDGATIESLFSGLAVVLATSTREGELPYLRSWSRRTDEAMADLSALASDGTRDGTAQSESEDPERLPESGSERELEPLCEAVLEGGIDTVFDELRGAITDGVSPRRIAGVLIEAASHRLFRFDGALARDPDVAENWLWATHRLTFACAVYDVLAWFERPEALRFLFQTAAFTRIGQPMDLPEDRRMPIASLPDDADVAVVGQAILAYDSYRAVRRVAAAMSHAPDALEPVLRSILLEDRHARPITRAHAIKTTMAALRAWRDLDDDGERGRMAVLGAVRFLSEPLADGALLPVVHRAVRWVVDGEVPRKLTQ